MEKNNENNEDCDTHKDGKRQKERERNIKNP